MHSEVVRDFPKISVLLPFHGECEYIIEAIQSCLIQTFQFFELILINDRASINTLAKVDEFKFDSRVKVVTSPKPGIVEALNYGLTLAKGDYIARMDADDLMEPQRLIEQYKEFKTRENLVLLGTQIHYIDSSSKIIGRSFFPTGPKKVEKKLKLKNVIAHPSAMYKKEIAIKVGGYRDIFAHAEDFDLWSRISRLGEIDNLSFPLLCYRQHSNQVSRLFDVKQAESTYLISILNFLPDALSLTNLSLDSIEKSILDNYSEISLEGKALVDWWRFRINKRKKHYFKALRYLIFSFLRNPLVFIEFIWDARFRLLHISFAKKFVN
jgi:glycosyltransferase involved in cell wall biosynthesis